MKKTMILSDRRPIVECELLGRKRLFLIDTGASVGMVHDGVRGTHPSGRSVPIVDASGDETRCPVLRDTASVGGMEVGQFVSMDISAVRESIRRQTGLSIDGLLSWPQLVTLGATLRVGELVMETGD